MGSPLINPLILIELESLLNGCAGGSGGIGISNTEILSRVNYSGCSGLWSFGMLATEVGVSGLPSEITPDLSLIDPVMNESIFPEGEGDF